MRNYASNTWEEYVKALGEDGWDVYWPSRDTDQADAIGLKICDANRNAIESADRVFVIWDGKSTGCLFDLGMAWALRKPITILQCNSDDNAGKSFAKMIRAWEEL